MQSTTNETNVNVTPIRTFNIGRGGKSGHGGAMPSDAERQEAYTRLEQGFPTKQAAVEFLLSRNWTTSAICQTLCYDQDSNRMTKDGQPAHKAGDPLSMQHVNGIKQSWLAKQAEAAHKAATEAAKAKQAPAPATTVSELRKPVDAK
jgi:hypothetical protein